MLEWSNMVSHEHKNYGCLKDHKQNYMAYYGKDGELLTGQFDQHGEGASVKGRLKLLLCSQSASLARQGGELGDMFCNANLMRSSR